MTRLSEHLTSLEQAEVCNAFQRRLMVTDAIFKANELLERKGDKMRIHRDGMEEFLKVTCPHLWQAFKVKGPEMDSKELEQRDLKKIRSVSDALRGIDHKHKWINPKPPFAPFSDDEPTPRKRTVVSMRNEAIEQFPNHMVDDGSYRNKRADEAILEDLLPDYESHQKRDAELRRKKRLEQEGAGVF